MALDLATEAPMHKGTWYDAPRQGITWEFIYVYLACHEFGTMMFRCMRKLRQKQAVGSIAWACFYTLRAWNSIPCWRKDIKLNGIWNSVPAEWQHPLWDLAWVNANRSWAKKAASRSEGRYRKYMYIHVLWWIDMDWMLLDIVCSPHDLYARYALPAI